MWHPIKDEAYGTHHITDSVSHEVVYSINFKIGPYITNQTLMNTQASSNGRWMSIGCGRRPFKVSQTDAFFVFFELALLTSLSILHCLLPYLFPFIFNFVVVLVRSRRLAPLRGLS